MRIPTLGEGIKLIALLGACLFLAGMEGCASSQQWDATANYAGDNDAMHTLAMKLPKGTGPFPAIVFIHGGNWSSGDYHDMYDFCVAAAERNYVGIAVNYRLTGYHPLKFLQESNINPWPAQLEDVKLAVQWLKGINHLQIHSKGVFTSDIIDGRRIGVAGFSSGGHIALMMGLTNSDMGNVNYTAHTRITDLRGYVRAVCSLAGPTNLIASYCESEIDEIPIIEEYPREIIKSLFETQPVFSPQGSCSTDCTPDSYSYCSGRACLEEAAVSIGGRQLRPLAWASPYYQPDANRRGPINNTVPILMMQAQDDTVVPFHSQHELFYAKLTGIREQKVYPDGGHQFFIKGRHRSRNDARFQDVCANLFYFLDRYVKNS